MAQAYATGPVDLWCGLGGGLAVDGGGASPVFLGHGDRGPRLQIRRAFEQVFCDLTGSQIPYDFMYEGIEALISVDLSRWNEKVYQEICNVFSQPNRASPGTGTLVDLAGARGALVATEGYSLPLWMRFPYAAKSAMQNATFGAMPSGYHFFSTILEGPDDREPLGTSPNKIRLMFHAWGIFVPSSGIIQLGDYDMSSLGVIN